MFRLWRRKPKPIEFADPSPTRAARRELIEGLMRHRTKLCEPARSYIRVLTMENVDLEDRLAQCRLERRTIRRERDSAVRERDSAVRSREELIQALIRLDAAVGAAIEREASGAGIDLGEIDEIRGSIWAIYNAASDALGQGIS